MLQALAERDASRLRKAQRLSEHSNWVVEEADRISSTLGLDNRFHDMLLVAAALHDSGKGRDLWQTAMGAASDGRPFAKTDSCRANGRALGGYRHEFGSLRDAEPMLAAIPDESLRDLARHLIAAHHGFARPSIPPIDPADPPSLLVERSQTGRAALR